MPVALQSWRASAVHASDVNSRDLMLAAINDLFVAEAIANPSTYKWVVANFNAGTGRLVLKPSVNNVGAATRRICFFVTVAGTFNQAALGLQTYAGTDGLCIGYSATANVDVFDNSQHSGAPFNDDYIAGGLVAVGAHLSTSNIDRLRYWECDAGVVFEGYRPSAASNLGTCFVCGAGELVVSGDNETEHSICWSTGDAQNATYSLVNAFNAWTSDASGSTSAGNAQGFSTFFPGFSNSGQQTFSQAQMWLAGWGASERVSRAVGNGTWQGTTQNANGSSGLGFDSDDSAFFLPVPMKRNVNSHFLGKLRQIAQGPRGVIGEDTTSDAVVIAKALAPRDDTASSITLWFTEFYV